MLEQEDAEKVLAIYTSPPAVNVDSDEDSREEDGGGFIDNLSRQQLRASAEAILQNDRLDGNEAEDTNAGDEAVEGFIHNSPQTSQTNSKRRKIPQKSTIKYKWSKEVKFQLIQQNLNPANTSGTLDFSGKSAVDIFEFFFMVNESITS